ncbi:MAG: hypothetical protein ISP40_10390 [Alphaproteobacteria bacterium]|nr:hypothetical protein [Alphaproteobacteria bacterium]
MRKSIMNNFLLVLIIFPFTYTQHALAHDITVSSGIETVKVSNVKFGSDRHDQDGTVTFDVTNLTDREIIAWKGSFVCKDAFGDEALSLNLKDSSANIKPGQSEISGFAANMFSETTSFLKNNDANNFDCGFTELKVAQ